MTSKITYTGNLRTEATHLTIMGIKAQNSAIDMEGAEVEITKIMASDPRRIQKILATIKMPNKPFTDHEK